FLIPPLKGEGRRAAPGWGHTLSTPTRLALLSTLPRKRGRDKKSNLPQHRENLAGALERIAGLRAVAHHLALEHIDRFEFLLVADPPDEGDVDRPAIEVAVEVEQEHFQEGRAVVEHRPHAEAGDAIMALAADANAHGIDAVLETASRIELDVGGRKAKIAPAFFPVDHFAGDEPGRAEQLGGLHHLALAERRAHRAGGYRAALVLERRHDVDREAEPGALRAQISGRAFAVVAEMEIEADGGATNAKASD